MPKENIFIHIPKTGGTTLITAIRNTTWTGEADFYYRHITNKTKRSNCGDIFEPQNLEKYRQYNIFMMVRDPVDRVISEYYYLKERKNFMSLLNKPPSSFEDFIRNPQTQNYMTGFLVGKRIYDTSPATERDLAAVVNAMDAIPVYTGIFEYFEESLHYFRKVTGIEWKKEMEVKRMTFIRPEESELDGVTRKLILDKNQLDQQLYEHCLARFNAIKNEFKPGKMRFIKSKYNHIIPYALQLCLFEFCTENKFFLRTHIAFFKELTFHLANTMKISDGKKFVLVWNDTFLNTINHYFPGSPFYRELVSAYDSSHEPLEQMIAIGKAIDSFLDMNKNNSKYFKPFGFDHRLISEGKPTDKNIFNSFFGLFSKKTK